MSADLLRRAAEELRDHTEDLLGSPWTASADRVDSDAAPDHVAEAYGPVHAAYIALMHPPVALALADWLETNADWLQHAYESGFGRVLGTVLDRTDKAAVAMARVILREDADVAP